MRRRAFLTTVGLGITTATAGCSSQSQPGESSTATDDTTAEAAESTTDMVTDESTPTDTTTIEGERTRVERGETRERILGNDPLSEQGLRKPHYLALTNRTDEEYTLSLSIQGTQTASLDEQFILEPDATVSVSLTTLDTYAVRASALSTAATESLSIEPGQFTCNVTRTSIALVAPGTFESMTASTRMACPSVLTEDIAADSTVSKTLGGGTSSADGGGDTAHTVVVTNPTDEVWTVRAVLESDTMSQLDGIYTIEPGGKSRLRLTESGAYDIAVDVLESGGTVTFSLSPENFDCNVSTTQVTVGSDGQLDSTTLSTLIACVEHSETDSENETSP
ncbi:hypothetical protein [Halorhabdus rudnickae]|uniref:hypothetical protein n=1 Tax=Halorhabdus rudnickae TaxID=1775544 RepID=UPI0010828192|nr:hypothetical protein [Halorhabdus rudnickae]